MAGIIVAGSINMDVVARTERHPRPGETVKGSDLHYIPGGKGSNQAVAASRLADGVRLVGRLGRDAFGDTLTTFLQQENLDLSGLRYSEDTPSGTAIIVVDAGSENTIVIIPGSNAEVSRADVEAVELEAGDVVVSPFEIPQETILRLFQRAREAGARTVLNPAPAAEMIPGLLEVIDVLVVNETELAFFAGVPDVAEDMETIQAQAKSLRASAGQTLIVTLGARGVVCLLGDDLVRVDGLRVQAVDTTGAGDCFVGALAVALYEGQSLPDALTFANTAAALSVRRLGASTSMPRRVEVEAALDAMT